jgi:hypothetical protein
MPRTRQTKPLTRADTLTKGLTVPQWDALAAFVLALSFVVAPFIYLVGDLRAAMGVLAYNVADFLYGPAWAASLVTLVVALREQLGERAPRRMTLALMAAGLAAAAMLAVACIRSANRNYHIIHPELHLEAARDVLVVWTTLVAGLTGAGWHLLGWTFLLVGSSGWTSDRLPRGLSALYLAGGLVALSVYVLPDGEGLAGMLAVAASIWQGIWLLRPQPGRAVAA